MTTTAALLRIRRHRRQVAGVTLSSVYLDMEIGVAASRPAEPLQMFGLPLPAGRQLIWLPPS